MNRLSEMLLGLQARMPMCSICEERLHIIKRVQGDKGGLNLYYCIECFPIEAERLFEIMDKGA